MLCDCSTNPDNLRDGGEGGEREGEKKRGRALGVTSDDCEVSSFEVSDKLICYFEVMDL